MGGPISDDDESEVSAWSMVTAEYSDQYVDGATHNANDDGSMPMFSDETLTMIFEMIDPEQKGYIDIVDFILNPNTLEIREKLTEMLGGDYFRIEIFQAIDLDKNQEISLTEFI